MDGGPKSKAGRQLSRGRAAQASSEVFWDLVRLRITKAAGLMFTEKPGSPPGKFLPSLEHGPCPAPFKFFQIAGLGTAYLKTVKAKNRKSKDKKRWGGENFYLKMLPQEDRHCCHFATGF